MGAEKADRVASDNWIRRGGKDFREVCALAGMDGDFVRDAYIGGKINIDALKHGLQTRP